MAFRGWTARVRQAWQYVKAGVVRALGREPAREEYVAGGGEIEPFEWADAWTLGERAFAAGTVVEELRPEAMIVREYFEVVDIDYAGKYHLTAEMSYFDLNTQSWETKFVSTNMDDLATKADWENALIHAVETTEISPPVDWDRGVTFSNFIPEERG